MPVRCGNWLESDADSGSNRCAVLKIVCKFWVTILPQEFTNNWSRVNFFFTSSLYNDDVLWEMQQNSISIQLAKWGEATSMMKFIHRPARSRRGSYCYFNWNLPGGCAKVCHNQCLRVCIQDNMSDDEITEQQSWGKYCVNYCASHCKSYRNGVLREVDIRSDLWRNGNAAGNSQGQEPDGKKHQIQLCKQTFTK